MLIVMSLQTAQRKKQKIIIVINNYNYNNAFDNVIHFCMTGFNNFQFKQKGFGCANTKM